MSPDPAHTRLYQFVLWRSDMQPKLTNLGRELPHVIELGDNPAKPIFGYMHGDSLAALAWGSVRGPEGDLHLAVAPDHRRRGLAERLALRFFLRRNSSVVTFRLSLTGSGRAAFQRALSNLGFTEASPDTFERSAFSPPEVASLRAKAIELCALEAHFELDERVHGTTS